MRRRRWPRRVETYARGRRRPPAGRRARADAAVDEVGGEVQGARTSLLRGHMALLPHAATPSQRAAFTQTLHNLAHASLLTAPTPTPPLPASSPQPPPSRLATSIAASEGAAAALAAAALASARRAAAAARASLRATYDWSCAAPRAAGVSMEREALMLAARIARDASSGRPSCTRSRTPRAPPTPPVMSRTLALTSPHPHHPTPTLTPSPSPSPPPPPSPTSRPWLHHPQAPRSARVSSESIASADAVPALGATTIARRASRRLCAAAAASRAPVSRPESAMRALSRSRTPTSRLATRVGDEALARGGDEGSTPSTSLLPTAVPPTNPQEASRVPEASRAPEASLAYTTLLGADCVSALLGVASTLERATARLAQASQLSRGVPAVGIRLGLVSFATKEARLLRDAIEARELGGESVTEYCDTGLLPSVDALTAALSSLGAVHGAAVNGAAVNGAPLHDSSRYLLLSRVFAAVELLTGVHELVELGAPPRSPLGRPPTSSHSSSPPRRRPHLG